MLPRTLNINKTHWATPMVLCTMYKLIGCNGLPSVRVNTGASAYASVSTSASVVEIYKMNAKLGKQMQK